MYVLWVYYIANNEIIVDSIAPLSLILNPTETHTRTHVYALCTHYKLSRSIFIYLSPTKHAYPHTMSLTTPPWPNPRRNPCANRLGFHNVSVSYTFHPQSAAGSTVPHCTGVRRTGKSTSRKTAKRWIVSRWACPVESLSRCWGRRSGTARTGRKEPEMRTKRFSDWTWEWVLINKLTTWFKQDIIKVADSVNR